MDFIHYLERDEQIHAGVEIDYTKASNREATLRVKAEIEQDGGTARMYAADLSLDGTPNSCLTMLKRFSVRWIS